MVTSLYTSTAAYFVADDDTLVNFYFMRKKLKVTKIIIKEKLKLENLAGSYIILGIGLVTSTLGTSRVNELKKII